MAQLISTGQKVDKPWGHELIWAHTDRYVGKVLHINKGECLSYQYHRVKDETIRLLAGKLEMDVEVDGQRSKFYLSPGECLHIVPGMKHRMTALEDCDVLEVSTPELDDVATRLGEQIPHFNFRTLDLIHSPASAPDPCRARPAPRRRR